MRIERETICDVMVSTAVHLARLKATVLRNASRLHQPSTETAGESVRSKNVLWIFDHNAVPSDMAGNPRQFDHATHLEPHGWSSVIFATPFSRKTRTFNRPVSWKAPLLGQIEQGVHFTWVYTLPYAGDGIMRYLNMVSYLVVATWAGLRRPAPHVVLGSSPHLLTGLAALLIAKRHRVPFVLEVRDLWPDTLIDLGLTNPIVIRPLSLLEHLLYRCASGIVPVSNGIYARILAKGVPDAKLTLVPNAPSQVQVGGRTDREAFRARLGWTDRVVFIYSGAHGIANALDNVIAAVRILDAGSRALIVMLGDGPEKSRLMEQSVGIPHLQFLPSVPGLQVQAYLEAADVGIISLRASGVFEGVIPNKLIDYMVVGLPVVTTVPGESWRIIERAESGVLVEPDNPELLASAIERLACGQNLRQAFAENARVYAKGLPTRADTARTLAALLDGLSMSHLEITDQTTAIAASSAPEVET